MGNCTSLKQTKQVTNRIRPLPQILNLSLEQVRDIAAKINETDDKYNIGQNVLVKNLKYTERTAQNIILRFDPDGNGYIETKVFLCALILMGNFSFDQKAEELFHMYDLDSSLYLSLDETVLLMHDALNALSMLDGQPLDSLHVIHEKTRKFFAAADTDNDKTVNLKEFKTFLKTEPTIREVITNAGVSAPQELGKDFGTGEDPLLPVVDEDLELECAPPKLVIPPARQEKIAAIKKSDEDDMFAEESIEEGDQFLAVRQQYKAPEGFRPSKSDRQPPEPQLELKYVHGYRSHDVRNNLRYTSVGTVVYHAAGVGIVLDKFTNEQRFFRSHRDDIHCLAVSPDGTMIATGEIGPRPRLCLWDCSTMEELAVIQRPLVKGVKHVCFSKDGQYVGASDMSDDHNIAVFQIAPKADGKQMKIHAKGKGCLENIMSLAFSPNDDCLVATCVKTVLFFRWANGAIQSSKGTGWGTTAADTILCQAHIRSTLYTGTLGSEIIIWQGSAISGRFKAHENRINCMFATESGKLLSGSHDNTVKVWEQGGRSGLQLVRTIALNSPKVGSIHPAVVSVCAQGDSILVGTRGAEIIEFDLQGNADFLVRGHFNDELWGLALHPKAPIITTWGRDGMLATWDLNEMTQLENQKFPIGGDALALSNDGALIALGFLNGTLKILKEDFTPVVERKDRKGKALQVIKFSPDDSICVTGAHDQQILCYDVKNNFKPKYRLKGHSSTVKFIDFTLDGSAFQSLCQAYETLYFDLQSGKQNTRGASQYRNEKWHTWTHPLGWGVQGIWPPASDGSDINAVCRSNDGQTVATADDFGTVKLYKFPAHEQKEMAHHKYYGHSSHVTNVSFSNDGRYVITTGGEDKSIFQWKYVSANMPESTKIAVHEETKDQGIAAGDDFGMFEVEGDDDVGDEALAVLPALGNIRAMTPSNAKPVNPKQPVKSQMELKWAHGFRSFDTRNNLYFNNEENVVFCTAGLGVVQNLTTNTQEFFNKHKEDIVALAYHAGLNLVATGQMASKDLTDKSAMVNKKATQGKLVKIFLWNAKTCEQVGGPINGFHRRAISQLAFSNDGKYLLSVGKDDQNSYAVYDVESRKKLSSEGTDQQGCTDAQWNGNGSEFATCGPKHIKRYAMSQDGSVKASKLPVTALKQTPSSCNYVFQNQLVTGMSAGSLILWSGNSAGKTYEAHKGGALNCIVPMADDSGFYTAGSDGTILKWTAGFKATILIDLNKWKIEDPSITAMDFAQDGRILVGTHGAQILEVTSSVTPPAVLNEGHYKKKSLRTYNEVWGLTTHPTNPSVYASAGGDSKIRVWDFKQKKQIAISETFAEDPTSLDWRLDGKFIAVGDRNATVTILNAETLQVIDSVSSEMSQAKRQKQRGKQDFRSEQWIEVCKFSPNGKYVAFGNHGYHTHIQVIEIDASGKILTKPSIKSKSMSSSAINHLDWSQDSTTIICNNTGCELMAYAISGREIKPQTSFKSLADVEWQTVSLTIGYPVQGIFGGKKDYTDINTVARSRNGCILATGTDFGEVKLFNYPCIDEKSNFDTYYGHSAHVTKVSFTANDDLLISTGGGDMTVLVYDTDIGGLSEDLQTQYEPHPDDIEEVKVDRSRATKRQAKFDAIRAEEERALEEARGQKRSYFDEEDLGEGDEFLAVKPWKGGMRPPTGHKRPGRDAGDAPDVIIELEWVHGYRGSQGRDNLRYLKDGCVGYYAAGCTVVYDPVNHTQRIFNLHHDDVTAIAFDPDGQHIATGENGKRPSTFIVDSKTMNVKKELKHPETQNTVIQVQYSPSGKVLGVLAGDDDHKIVIYDTQSWSVIASGKTHRSNIIDMAFEDDTHFVTTGTKHYRYYTIENKKISGTNGSFGKLDQRISGCIFNNNDCLTGNINGDLYAWKGVTPTVAAPKLHERRIDCVMITDNLIFTGGRDSKIKVMDRTYKLQFLINLASTPNSICPMVRAITLNDAQDTLMVGTFGHEVIQVPVNLAQRSAGQATVLVHGHYAPVINLPNEAWGLVTFPKSDRYATVSDDATLRVWDTDTRKQIAMLSLEIDLEGKPIQKVNDVISASAMARSIDISPDEQYMALGMRDGSIRVYKSQPEEPFWTYEHHCVCADAKNSKFKLAEWIEDLKFSPDGQYLMVGSHNNGLYLFIVPNFDNFVKVDSASSSYITHLDWSLDSKAVRTNDGSYELLYYSIPDIKQLKSGATQFRDEPWATQSCVLGWNVQGIWQAGMDGSDINHADRSHQPVCSTGQVVATADDRGKVSIFKYPSPVEKPAKAVIGHGHSSHVTKCRFNATDTHLFTVGGNDTTVMQWRIRKA